MIEIRFDGSGPVSLSALAGTPCGWGQPSDSGGAGNGAARDGSSGADWVLATLLPAAHGPSSTSEDGNGMTSTSGPEDPRNVVDRLDEELVDVDQAAEDDRAAENEGATDPTEESGAASDDVADDVSGSPEPPD